MIRHTVTFSLHHKEGSEAESIFLSKAKELATIPNVHNFQCLKEIGKKNDFDFGLSMEFKHLKDYNAYNIHPIHVNFVEKSWKPEVKDFIEIDYQLTK